MATTFSNTFKNRTVDTITGRGSTNNGLYYAGFYNGAQAADPTTTPAGTMVFSSYSVGPQIGTFMGQAGGGVATLNTPRSGTASNTVTSITFARIYDSGGSGMIDTDATLVGGGGGAIVASLSSSASSPYALNAFGFQFPLALSTVKLNSSLANAIVNAWCTNPTNVALGTSGNINIYSGSAPASADDAPTGTLLCSFVTGGTSPWAAASGGAASLTTSLAQAAAATGTAGYARIVKGSYVLQGSVGTSATDFIIDSTSLTTGVTVNLTDATITF